ncbi:MAG: cell surface protein [Verrucomicrobiales bacterium]|nr:cell surface protein [Verrucomicrobiales bacterium]
MKITLTICGILCLAAGSTLAGPYAPAAGQPGTTAIARTDPRFSAWANRAASYQPGTGLSASWQDVSRALGPATDDPTHITGLGSGGTITLTFPGFIKDGPGADFAVFENSFSDTFIEHAWVEVSRDGVHFTRFPNHSLTTQPVGAFGSIDPTDVQGLAGKYRQPFGEPFDLAEVGLDGVSHVRLVDVVGDGSARDSEGRVIYDPYPVSGSAGFDLDAIAVIHLRQWQTLTVGFLNGDGINATAFAHRPDGRFLLGIQGVLRQQTTWSQAASAVIGNGGVEFDPAFLASAPDGSALLGVGGGFGGNGGLHRFFPNTPSPVLEAVPVATLPGFAGTWWSSPVSGKSGWIIGGPQGASQRHGISFVSPDGAVAGPIISDISTYSAGVAVDAAGNVYAARYELPGSPAEANAEWVLKFTAAQIDSAVNTLPAGPAALTAADGLPLFQFDSASSLAVDARGRLWAGGFKSSQLQIYDPATGATRRLSPDHDPVPGVTDALYQVQTFTASGESYAAFLLSEELGTPGSGVLHGIAPLSAITVPEALDSWRSYQFGAAAVTPGQEATLWGNAADPDADGIPNLLEYALNTPPLRPNAPALNPGRSSGRLTLTFNRHPLRPDLELIVEGASDPAGPWTALACSARAAPFAAVLPAAPAIVENAVDPVVEVTVRDVVSATVSPRRFLRLRAVVLP